MPAPFADRIGPSEVLGMVSKGTGKDEAGSRERGTVSG